MRKIILLFALFASLSYTQSLTDVRICIDPGHGGHEDDDRYIEATGFWESESNLTKGLELRSILLDLGATVAITRTGNNGTTDDPSLSERVGLANSFNADYFTSIHSNGYNGTSNYTMVIYNGHTETPTYPLARTMALIMAPAIHAVDYTTSSLAIGDLTLNPSWTYGYGVLYPANMPATISEGSFHDYIPESWRLMNLDYRRHEARAIARSFLEYFGEPGFGVGAIAGVTRDIEATVDYFSFASMHDNLLPVNNIQASIEPGGYSYSGGLSNNGYFKVDSLPPGQYEVVVNAAGYATDSVSVNVIANTTSFANFQLQNNAPPIIVASHPEDADSTFPAWEIPYFDFSKAMDEASVENAFSIDPATEGTIYFTADHKRIAFLASDTLDFLTDYTIIIAGTALDLSGHYLDGDQDGVGGDDWQIGFRTSPADNLAPNVIATYPISGADQVDLRPIFTIVWDEELEPAAINDNLIKMERIADLQVQATTLEHRVIAGHSILSLYAANDLLDAESYRVRVFPGFEDLFGNTQRNGTLINFTTANYNYTTTSIDDFEQGLTSNWWQPNASGSTTGIIASESSMSPSNSPTVLNQASETAMALNYSWDADASNWLIREYLASGAPQAVHFTATQILQAYVFGDGNGNQFRFCVDDNVDGSGGHEVSPWYEINWYGWQLVSWDMAVEGTGTWIGDGSLDGTLAFDSIQLTHTTGQATVGTYYIDDLRVVNRNYLGWDGSGNFKPLEFALLPNYPNPFNPWTNIPFTLAEQTEVDLRIYDLKGEQVTQLIQGPLAAGYHVTRWNAAHLASGIYLVKLRTPESSLTRKITILK